MVSHDDFSIASQMVANLKRRQYEPNFEIVVFLNL